MIIEEKDYVDAKTIEEIRSSIAPYIPKNKTTVYNRNGKTTIISTTPELKETTDKVNSIFSKLSEDIVSRRFKPQRPSASTDLEHHLYEPGDVCYVHSDGEIPFGSKNNCLIRYATVILHLNTVEEGGETVFPNQNKTIKTEAGKIIVFPPYGMYPHYTTPSKEPREILMTWFVYSDVNAYLI